MSLIVTVKKNRESQQAASLITYALQDENARNQFFGYGHPFHFDFPVAIKTGTSSNWKDNWSFGFTENITIGVWVGNFTGASMEGTSGATGAGPVLRDLIKKLSTNHKREPIKTQHGLVNSLICSISGKKPGPHCPHKSLELFIPNTESEEVCDYHQQVNIDIRNGFLAGNSCPERYIKKLVTTVYPDDYKNWAITSGKGIHRYSPLCKSKNLITSLKIDFPKNGSRFLIDPSKKRQFQTIPLQIIAKGSIDEIAWYINGKLFDKTKYPYQSRFPLKKGKHRLQAKAHDVSSNIVEFEVQ